MFTAEQLLEKINGFIDSMPYTRRPMSLYEPVRYVLSLGGKRIRPTLMLLAYNMYKDNPEDILPVACGIETYHNYTLLHDDLMDNASVRRGHATVHKKWNANTAILSGDSMLVMAYRYISQCDEDKLRQVLGLFTVTALEIGEGQQYDMDFETRSDVREEEYIEMIRLKTSVLLACALKIGAMLGGAPAGDADNLYRFGEKVGLAFQLQDDYLDVYGNPEVFGKAIGGDILCNKKTFMLINAYRRADAQTRAELDRWMGGDGHDPQQKIAAVTAIYNRLGIDRLAEAKINLYFNESREYLSRLGVPACRLAELEAYTANMMKRNR